MKRPDGVERGNPEEVVGSVSDLGQQPTPSLGLVKTTRKKKKKKKSLAQEVLTQFKDIDETTSVLDDYVLTMDDLTDVLRSFLGRDPGALSSSDVKKLKTLKSLSSSILKSAVTLLRGK